MNDRLGGKCWQCGGILAGIDYGRETACPGCGKPTRVCRNCRDFAPGRPNDCLEPLAERVLDKERANFCEYFQPTAEPAAKSEDSAEALRQAAEALFK